MVWVDLEEKTKEYDIRKLILKKEIILNVVISKLNHLKQKKILLDKNIDLGLPESEKKFFGRIPYGTRIKPTKDKNLMVGVNWDSKGTIEDLDLSALSDNGKFGWDGSLKDGENTILHSGDIVQPTEEGVSEIISINGKSKLTNTYLITNNIFTGSVSGKYGIYVGVRDRNEGSYDKGKMMDSNEILLDISDYSQRKRQTVIGVLGSEKNGNTFTFCEANINSSVTSKTNKVSEKATKILWNKTKSDYKLPEILMYWLGCDIVYDESEDYDLDLRVDKIDKNTLIELLESP